MAEQRDSFASITEKIQRFSLNTSSSTQEIRTIFEEMSANVARVKAEAVTCFHEIHSGAEQLIPASGQLKRIAERGMRQHAQDEHFGRLLDDQMIQTEETKTSLSQYKASSDEKRQLLQNLKAALEEFEKLSRELKRLLKKWK